MDFVVMSVVACMALLLVELYDDLSGNWVDRGGAGSASVDMPAGASVTAAGEFALGTLATGRPSGSEAFDQAA